MENSDLEENTALSKEQKEARQNLHYVLNRFIGKKSRTQQETQEACSALHDLVDADEKIDEKSAK
jgi:hypothetical protein